MTTSARPRISDTDSLCGFLEVGGHEVQLYPIVMGMQGWIVDCFEAAMTAVVVQGPQQVDFARKLHDHAVIQIEQQYSWNIKSSVPKTKNVQDRHQCS